MAYTDIFKKGIGSETRRIVDEMNDEDKAFYDLISYEWELNNLKDPFLIMQLEKFCSAIADSIEKRYSSHGSAWKRKVASIFKQFAISFGMRLTKARMERAFYE